MKERPILFNAEMVKAILEGRKTQTRRVIKPQPELSEKAGFCWKGFYYGLGSSEYETKQNFIRECSPYGAVDNHRFTPKTYCRLWVRERFLLSNGDFAPTLEEELTKKPNVMYYASDHPRYRDRDKWKPSIFMPRWASRITLEITDIRVERVQEITGEDAQAEGWNPFNHLFPTVNATDKAWLWFKQTWDKINAKRGFGWDNNPWVWVVEFKRIEK